MNKNWRYKAGNSPFSVTEVLCPNDTTILVSVSRTGVCRCHTADGLAFDIKSSIVDLVEIGEYDHIEVDQKVFVWNNDAKEPIRAYFAGVSKVGKPLAFVNGKTKWASKGEYISWGNCKAVEEYFNG